MGYPHEAENHKAITLLECDSTFGLSHNSMHYCLGIGTQCDGVIVSIQLKNLTLVYEKHPAVHHLTATIERGDLLAIVGPNGAGKSTLLNALAGLTRVEDGSISGLNPDEVSYLPQQTQIDKSFPLTVAELVATGFWSSVGFHESIGRKQQLQSEAAIAAVGLQGFEGRMINTLSGGQMQRTLFARVLLQDLPIILLDEPFNAIDAKTVLDLTQVIKSWHQDKRTIVMVSHDMEYVHEHCPKTLLLAREKIGYGITHEVLTKDNIKRAQHLCEAFDESAIWCKKEVA